MLASLADQIGHQLQTVTAVTPLPSSVSRSIVTHPVPIILLAGIVAALNIGKLPPALPALQAAFSITLVQASFLVSAFQVAGMTLGLVGGLMADRFGPRRVMTWGLALLTIANAAGALAGSATSLLVLRALESGGFILTVLPGPALLRRAVPSGQLSKVMGSWGCYMPAGMASMMVFTPWLLAGPGGWAAAWLLCAAMAALTLALVLTNVPRDPVRGAAARGVRRLANDTLRSAGPWALALCFGLYAAQFIAVFSFLPSAYLAIGVSAAAAGSLSAIGVAVNIVGNLASGILIGRGVPRHWLIGLTSLVMAGGAAAALDEALPFSLRFAAVLGFSLVGGLIPGTLFATAPRFAPHIGAISTTTGLMQQGSTIGQFVSPPLVAAVASGAGGWTQAGQVVALLAVANVAVAMVIGRIDRDLPRRNEQRLDCQSGAQPDRP